MQSLKRTQCMAWLTSFIVIKPRWPWRSKMSHETSMFVLYLKFPSFVVIKHNNNKKSKMNGGSFHWKFHGENIWVHFQIFWQFKVHMIRPLNLPHSHTILKYLLDYEIQKQLKCFQWPNCANLKTFFFKGDT
jgi:hypothetical protein